MTEVAGEVADGMLVHAFTTAPLPARGDDSRPSSAGSRRPGAARGDLQLCYPAFVVTGKDEREWEAARTAVTRQIAFYGSTPAYRGVLEAARLGRAPDRSSTCSRSAASGWKMGELITDDILEEFAVVARSRARWRARSSARFGGLVDRIVLRLHLRDFAERQPASKLRARRPLGRRNASQPRGRQREAPGGGIPRCCKCAQDLLDEADGAGDVPPDPRRRRLEAPHRLHGLDAVGRRRASALLRRGLARGARGRGGLHRSAES